MCVWDDDGDDDDDDDGPYRRLRPCCVCEIEDAMTSYEGMGRKEG